MTRAGRYPNANNRANQNTSVVPAISNNTIPATWSTATHQTGSPGKRFEYGMTPSKLSHR